MKCFVTICKAGYENDTHTEKKEKEGEKEFEFVSGSTGKTETS